MISSSGIQLMQPRLLKHAGAALAHCQHSCGVSWTARYEFFALEHETLILHFRIQSFIYREKLIC